MLNASLQIENLIRIVDPSNFTLLLLDRLSKFVQLNLLSLLELHFQQGNLVFEIWNDQVVPPIVHFLQLLSMCFLQGDHFVRMLLVSVNSSLLLFEDPQLFQALPGLLRLIELTFTLAVLAMFVQHEKEVF